MKKLLNPRLNTQKVTVLDDISSDKEPEIDEISIRRKKTAAAKTSPSHPTKVKGSSQSVKELSQSEPQLSAIFLEIRNELLKQQQEEKAEVSHVEDQEWEDEDELILR